MQLPLSPNETGHLTGSGKAHNGLEPQRTPEVGLRPLLAAGVLVLVLNTAIEWLQAIMLPLAGQTGSQLADIILTSLAAIAGIYCALRQQALAHQRILQQIMEREQSEATLAKLRHRYELILNAVEEGVYGIDTQGIVIFQNPAAAALLGWDPAALIGHPIHAMVHHSRSDGTPYPQAECPIQATLRDGLSRHGDDEVFWRPDGTPVPVEYASTPMHNEQNIIVGVVVVFRDITQRQQTALALRQERDFSSAVVDTVGNLVVVFDCQGRIIRFNHACEQLSGYSFNEVQGRKLFGLLLAEEEAAFQDGFADLCAGHFPHTHENLWVAKTGHRHLIAWTNTALLDAAGAVEYVIATGMDITQRWQAEVALQQAHADLEQAQLETLQRLALAAEYRDDDTGLHTKRVGLTSRRIAVAMGLPSTQLELLLLAAPLHDVGKIGVPDEILLKPGKLTDEEFAIMRRHTVIGAKMVSGSTSPWLRLAEAIALTHHERWDGRGYPQKLIGEAIPLVGRIVAVADVFDALTHERPYKKAWPLTEAITEIARQSGAQFDPCVVEAFLALPHADLL